MDLLLQGPWREKTAKITGFIHRYNGLRAPLADVIQYALQTV
ncbi:MAG: hypothetical protein VW945_06570 [Candidatus Poseidoniales archaeon]